MEWTIKEAAEEVGISVKALRYRIKVNGLEPSIEESPNGPRYVLSEDQLAVLRSLPSNSDKTDTESSPRTSRTGLEEGTEDRPQEGPQYPPQDRRSIPIDVHMQTQEALQEALELSREQRVDRLDAERRAAEAEERAMRIARQAQVLMEEMGTHKRLLSENAESLLEQRAEVQELEARAEEAVTKEEQSRAQLEELYRHNAEEKARYEKEREELLEKLKLSDSKAHKLEKLPRWVTKLFGT